MIEVKKALETKDTLVYETATHIFKIDEEKVEKAKEDLDALKTKIQKSMRQTVDISCGSFWDESYKAIFEEISGVKLD